MVVFHSFWKFILSWQHVSTYAEISANTPISMRAGIIPLSHMIRSAVLPLSMRRQISFLKFSFGMNSMFTLAQPERLE